MRSARTRGLGDGRVEHDAPMIDSHGRSKTADRAGDRRPDAAVDLSLGDSEEAAAARVRHGGVSARTSGDLSGQPNLVRVAGIAVRNGVAPEREDPFAAFAEWVGEADSAAYRDL